MMSKPLSPSGSPGVFRPMMLNPVVGSAGHRKHVTPPPLRVLALLHGWCGEFYHSRRPHHPSCALWERVLLPL